MAVGAISKIKPKIATIITINSCKVLKSEKIPPLYPTHSSFSLTLLTFMNYYKKY
jgi:hypothetical protein